MIIKNQQQWKDAALVRSDNKNASFCGGWGMVGGQCKIKTHFADWVLNIVFNVWEFRTGKEKYSTDLTVSEAIPTVFPVAPHSQQTDPYSLCLGATTETLLLPMLLRSNTSGFQDVTILRVLHIAIILLTPQFLGTVPCHKNFKNLWLAKAFGF